MFRFPAVSFWRCSFCLKEDLNWDYGLMAHNPASHVSNVTIGKSDVWRGHSIFLGGFVLKRE